MYRKLSVKDKRKSCIHCGKGQDSKEKSLKKAEKQAIKMNH